MARGVNKAIVVGNVCNKPVLSSNTQDVYLSLIVATNDRERDLDTGEWVDCTDKHKCVLSGSKAEYWQHRIKQGQKLYIEGKMKMRAAKAKRCGHMQYFHRIDVKTIRMLSPVRAIEAGDQQSISPSPHPLEPASTAGGAPTGRLNGC